MSARRAVLSSWHGELGVSDLVSASESILLARQPCGNPTMLASLSDRVYPEQSSQVKSKVNVISLIPSGSIGNQKEYTFIYFFIY
jgi:hypothetical protein